jgi:hypothetical protein
MPGTHRRVRSVHESESGHCSHAPSLTSGRELHLANAADNCRCRAATGLLSLRLRPFYDSARNDGRLPYKYRMRCAHDSNAHMQVPLSECSTGVNTGFAIEADSLQSSFATLGAVT